MSKKTDERRRKDPATVAWGDFRQRQRRRRQFGLSAPSSRSASRPPSIAQSRYFVLQGAQLGARLVDEHLKLVGHIGKLAAHSTLAFVPERVVTDDLRSYGAATRDLGIERLHVGGR
jgi:hypothetical protein